MQPSAYCGVIQTLVQKPHHNVLHASDASDDSDDGISVEQSQSGEDDTVRNPPQSPHRPHKRCDIKDWTAVDFNIMRDAAMRKVCRLPHLLQH